MDSAAKSLIAIKLNHPNIIKYHYAFKHNRNVIVITEAAMGGELYDYIQKYQQMSEPTARTIIHQISKAIQYCHSRGVVHRQLRLENILFKNEYEDDFLVKIINFGITGTYINFEELDHSQIAYMAPELVEQIEFGPNGKTSRRKEQAMSEKDRLKRETKKYKKWKSIHFSGEESDEKSLRPSDSPQDVWAIGVMFYAMIYGCLPFSATEKKELIDMI